MGRVGGSVVERSLSIPEADGSNPVIGKKYVEYLLSTVIEKTKIKEKDTGKGTFKKNITYGRAVLVVSKIAFYFDAPSVNRA